MMLLSSFHNFVILIYKIVYILKILMLNIFISAYITISKLLVSAIFFFK